MMKLLGHPVTGLFNLSIAVSISHIPTLLPRRDFTLGRHPCSLLVYQENYLQLKYAFSIPEKVLICLNRGRTESLANDNVLALNNAERPQVRNGERKCPKARLG